MILLYATIRFDVYRDSRNSTANLKDNHKIFNNFQKNWFTISFNFQPTMAAVLDQPEPELTKRQRTIGLIFDGITGIVSLLDLTTDLIIMASWYHRGRMTFFWIGLSILILAQLSYLSVFHMNHGRAPDSKKAFFHSLLSCLCLVPLSPVLSFVFYLVSEEGSCLRSVFDKFRCFNFDWHSPHSDPQQSPTKKYLERKLYKSMGFLMEALFEAFPQRYALSKFHAMSFSEKSLYQS